MISDIIEEVLVFNFNKILEADIGQENLKVKNFILYEIGGKSG